MGFLSGLFRSDKNGGRYGRRIDDWTETEEEEFDDWTEAEEEEFDEDEPAEEEVYAEEEELPDSEYLSVLEDEQDDYEKFVRMVQADFLPVPYSVLGCRLISADEFKNAMGQKGYDRFINNCVSCLESVAPKSARVFLYEDNEMFCYMESGDKEELDEIILRFMRMIKYISGYAKFAIDYSINSWGRLYTLEEITYEVSEKIENNGYLYSV